MDQTMQKLSDYGRILKPWIRYAGIIIMFGALLIGLFTGSPFFPTTPEGWFWFGCMLIAATEVRK